MKIILNRKAFLSFDGKRKNPHREMHVVLLTLKYFNPCLNHDVCSTNLNEYIWLCSLTGMQETRVPIPVGMKTSSSKGPLARPLMIYLPTSGMSEHRNDRVTPAQTLPSHC